MTAPEIMRAFELCTRTRCPPGDWPRLDVYPLYIGAQQEGTWYVRERLPGTRVWRAEEDGSFTLLEVA